MAKTVLYGVNRPNEEVIEWFTKHVGPRTHYLMNSVGGKGWRFQRDLDKKWLLTVEDEKMLMYWTLMK